MGIFLITIGVGCIIGAIIGGGVKMVQIELSPVTSLWRQLLLGAFGLILLVWGVNANSGSSKPDEPGKQTIVPGGGATDTNSTTPQTHTDAASTDYVIPGSDSRPLTASDLAGLSPAQLRIARNEIYARHGRRFQSADLAAYFARKPWYHPVDGAVNLSPLEQANVDLIAKSEKAGG